MKDLKERILAQIDEDNEGKIIKFIEQDLDIFFDEVRRLKNKINLLEQKKE